MTVIYFFLLFLLFSTFLSLCATSSPQFAQQHSTKPQIVHSQLIWFNVGNDANYYTTFFSLDFVFVFISNFCLFDWLTFSCATSRLISLNFVGFLFHRSDCLHNVCVRINLRGGKFIERASANIGNLCTVHKRRVKMLHRKDIQALGAVHIVYAHYTSHCSSIQNQRNFQQSVPFFLFANCLIYIQAVVRCVSVCISIMYQKWLENQRVHENKKSSVNIVWLTENDLSQQNSQISLSRICQLSKSC